MSDELREALDWLDGYNWHGGPSLFYDERLKRHETVRAAARERLAQLEADPELVERIASALHDIDESDHEAESHPLRECWDAAIETYLRNARAVLAAISTPTPVEES